MYVCVFVVWSGSAPRSNIEVLAREETLSTRRYTGRGAREGPELLARGFPSREPDQHIYAQVLTFVFVAFPF